MNRSGTATPMCEPARHQAIENPGSGPIRGRGFAALLAAATLIAPPAMAQTFGLVADDATQTVSVFDLESNAVLAAIPVGPGGVVGDVAITPDQTLGFATDFNLQVWVIDLTTSPPSLATGINPIPISTNSEDLTVTADGRFLLVSDGGGGLSNTPLSVVDIAARTEIGAFFTGNDTVANDLCDDGSSVLIASRNGRSVRRLILAEDGSVTDTGESLTVEGVLNVTCAPGAASGVVVSNDGNVRSFAVPGLALVDTRTLPGSVVTAVFSPAGERVFLRVGFPEGSVEAYEFNPATGTLGAAPADSVPVEGTNLTFGIDRLAIGDGAALYVPERAPVSAVTLLDAADLAGLPLGSVTGPAIVGPTGVAVARVPAFEAFAAFDAVLELDDHDVDYDDELELELDGEFTLGAASNGIDPASEEVSLTIGSLSVTVPAGAFKPKARDGAFEFEGRTDGGEFEIEIKLLMDGTYNVEAEFDGAGSHRLAGHVEVVLTIGDDRGETVARVKFDD